MYLLRADALRQLIDLSKFVEEEVACLILPSSQVSRLVMLVMRTTRLHINLATGEVDTLGIQTDLWDVSDQLFAVRAFNHLPELEQAIGMVLWLAQEYRRFPVALLETQSIPSDDGGYQLKGVVA